MAKNNRNTGNAQNMRNDYGNNNNSRDRGNNHRGRNGNRNNRNQSPKKVGNLWDNDPNVPHSPDHNHPEWFEDPAGLVNDNARVSSFFPGGKIYRPTTVVTSDTHIPTTPYGTFKRTTPSVMVCEWIPLPGVAKSSADPMSIAAQIVFQKIRETLNKPVENYQFADPFMAYNAFLSMVIMANEIRRDYGIVNTYHSTNYSYPDALLSGLGYNRASIADLKNNLANYRNRYSQLMYAASTIYLPFSNNIALKYQWLTENVWLDRSTEKAQLYMYRAAGVYMYDDALTDKGGGNAFISLAFEDIVKEDRCFKYKLDILEGLIEALRGSDSYNYMISDLKRAFADAPQYKFNIIEEGYTVMPAANDDMLNQFQNIMTLPLVDIVPESFNITQDVELNTILSGANNLTLVQPAGDTRANRLYLLNGIENYFEKYGIPTNFVGDDVSDKKVISLCNPKCLWKVSLTSQQLSVSRSGDFSCYVPTCFRYVYASEQLEIESGEWLPMEYFVGKFGTFNVSQDTICNILSHFDWCPMVFVLPSSNKSGAELSVDMIPICETDNMVWIPMTSFKAMNEAEQYALWNVPYDTSK